MRRGSHDLDEEREDGTDAYEEYDEPGEYDEAGEYDENGDPYTDGGEEAYGRPRRRGGVRFLLFLCVAGALFFVASRVCVVREITVEGNQYCTAEEVIAAAGIAYGDSLLTLRAGRVESGINANRYLEYVGLWRDFPSRVILRVEEDSPRAKINRMGRLILLGKNCVVLEEIAQTDIMPHLPLITGVSQATVRKGQPIEFSEAGCLQAIEAVLAEVESQGLSGDVVELNVSTLDSLYLITSDGLQVVLGDREDIETKIFMLRSVLSRLRGVINITGGVLDVSAGITADFRPAG